jgi:hypothetical protein
MVAAGALSPAGGETRRFMSSPLVAHESSVWNRLGYRVFRPAARALRCCCVMFEEPSRP